MALRGRLLARRVDPGSERALVLRCQLGLAIDDRRRMFSTPLFAVGSLLLPAWNLLNMFKSTDHFDRF